eukprot:187554_1
MSTSRSSNKGAKCMPEWKQKLINLAKQDINAQRNEYWFPAPQSLADLLGVEHRDLPLFYNIFDCVVMILLNLCFIWYFLDGPWHYFALFTVVRMVMLGLPRFALALHYSSHLAIIKPAWLNSLIIEYLVTPFFGLPAGMYRYHHVVMHHKEDNQYPMDLSSTMTYDRSKFASIIHYWLRFECGIWVELPLYLWKKRFYLRFVNGIVCLFGWFVMNYYVWVYIRPAVALWLFLIPQLVCSLPFMWGNFSQHIFVDPLAYKDDHRLTINLVGTPYNQVTFNDGYHIIHHKYPKCHWSEMPHKFITEKEMVLHGQNDALCFTNIDYFMLGAHVWFGFWDRLVSKHFVPSNQKQADMTQKEIIRFLKSRLEAVWPDKNDGQQDRLDYWNIAK